MTCPFLEVSASHNYRLISAGAHASLNSGSDHKIWAFRILRNLLQLFVYETTKAEILIMGFWAFSVCVCFSPERPAPDRPCLHLGIEVASGHLEYKSVKCSQEKQANESITWFTELSDWFGNREWVVRGGVLIGIPPSASNWCDAKVIKSQSSGTFWNRILGR